MQKTTTSDEKTTMFDIRAKANASAKELVPFLKEHIVHSPDGWDEKRVDDALNLLAVSMVMEEANVEFPINFEDVVAWLGVRKDNLKRVLSDSLQRDTDYQILLLTQEEQVSYKKSNHGGQNKDTIMLTVRGAMKLCVLSKSKGAAMMSDFLLDIMDLFKAGIRDSSNTIFNKIRECVGIKMAHIGAPDYSVKDPVLPDKKRDYESGRMIIKRDDLSDNPIDTIRALGVGIAPDTHPAFCDVVREAAEYMVHQKNEIGRVRLYVDDAEDKLKEANVSIDCLRKQVDMATGTSETHKWKTMAHQLRVQVDSLSLLVAAKFKKGSERAMETLRAATAIVPEHELENLGNAVMQASIISTPAIARETERVYTIVKNILGMLVYSHKTYLNRSENETVVHEEKMGALYYGFTPEEQQLNDDYYDDLEQRDEDMIGMAVLSKLVGKADKRTREAVYRYAVANVNRLPIELNPIVEGAIEVYYGDAAFAPYFWPTGNVERGRDIMVYFAYGPIAQPINNHLICGGRIMTNGVDQMLTQIHDEYKKYVWNGDISPNIYTVGSHIAFLQDIEKTCNAVAVFMRNETGQWCS